MSAEPDPVYLEDLLTTADNEFITAAEHILTGCCIRPKDTDEHPWPVYDPPFEDTPQRFARALLELTEGHREPCPELRTFEYTGPPQLIASLHNQAYTLCPHHLLAVELSCSIGYVACSPDNPNGQMVSGEESGAGKILGLSKIPRLIHWASRRLTTQEDLAQLLASRIFEATQSQAIFIHIEGTHSCMRARGIKTNGTVITTLQTGPEVGHWEQQWLSSLHR